MTKVQYRTLYECIDKMIIKLEDILQSVNPIDNINDNHIKLTIKELNKIKNYEYGDGWIPYYPKGWIDAGVTSDNSLFLELSDILELWKNFGLQNKESNHSNRRLMRWLYRWESC